MVWHACFYLLVSSGKVSSGELEGALRYLRDQLSPSELALVLSQLKDKADTSADTKDKKAGPTAAASSSSATEEPLPKLITLEEEGEGGSGAAAATTPGTAASSAPKSGVERC